MSEVVLFFKIVGSVLILFSGSALGVSIGGDLARRLRELYELKKLFYIIKSEIAYGGFAIYEVFENASQKTIQQYQAWLIYIKKETYDCSEKLFSEIWSESVERYLNATALNKSDKQELLELGVNFGTIDKEQQMTMIELYLQKLENSILELQQDLKNKGRLYSAIGIGGSSFLVIALL